jgi:hypothetical protein
LFFFKQNNRKKINSKNIFINRIFINFLQFFKEKLEEILVH